MKSNSSHCTLHAWKDHAFLFIETNGILFHGETKYHIDSVGDTLVRVFYELQ